MLFHSGRAEGACRRSRFRGGAQAWGVRRRGAPRPAANSLLAEGCMYSWAPPLEPGSRAERVQACIKGLGLNYRQPQPHPSTPFPPALRCVRPAAAAPPPSRTALNSPTAAPPPARRIHSFCDASLVAKNPTMMVVEDTLQDARYCMGSARYCRARLLAVVLDRGAPP